MRWGLAGLAVVAVAGGVAWQGLAPRPDAPAGAHAPTPLAPAPAAAPPAASPPAAAPPAAAPDTGRAAPATAPASPAPTRQAGAAADQAPPTAESGPRFDVARVAPSGGTVVAGRAAPGAEVVLMDQNQTQGQGQAGAEPRRELGRARADARGEFVIVPEAPLAAGAHALSLQAREGQGEARTGGETVVVVVPERAPAPATATTTERPAAPQQAMAVLIPSSGAAAPRVLQAPAHAGGALSLDVVDYDAEGRIRFAGGAPAGQALRLYIDQAHAGDAAGDAGGRWAFQPTEAPAPGPHLLRVDQLGPQGQVVARVEVPFLRDAAAQPAAAAATPAGPADRIVVQPGHSLWRIARESYGQGIRYTTIYQANAGQIRDPDRIYPGQIFTLPVP